MARSTTSAQQPSPPFYRGHRVTRHNQHVVTLFDQVNPQVTDAVTQANGQVLMPRRSDVVPQARVARLLAPPLNLP